MKPLFDIEFLDRERTAKILNVSIHTLEVWRSVGRHPSLHKTCRRFRGRKVYYELSDIEQFLKEWDIDRYNEYIANKGEGITG